MKKYALYLTTIAVVLLLWQLQAMRIDKADLFPYPSDVFHTLLDLLRTWNTYSVIFASLRRLAIAIGASTAVAIVLGIISGFKRTLGTLLQPIVTSLRTLPVASLIVIILIVYGMTRSLYVITFLMIFPLVYEAAKQGVLNMNPTLKMALALEKIPAHKKVSKVYLPLAFPYIKTGFLQSIGLGFKVLVMAEFIAQSPHSIGEALSRGRDNFQYDVVFAWTIILIVLVTLVEFGVNRLKSYT